MKRIGLMLVLGLLLISGACFAGVEAEIVGAELDKNSNIKFWVQYKVDGVEQEYKEQGQVIIKDGKKVIPLYMTAYNYMDRTDAEISQWIDLNIKYQCDNYIKQKFHEVTNIANISAILQKVQGAKILKDSAEIEIHDDADGVVDRKYSVKTDGTYVQETIPVTP